MKRCAWFVMMAVSLGAAAAAQPAGDSAEQAAPAGPGQLATQAPGGGNPFLGSVPTGAVSGEPVDLTLASAIERGLEHNLGVLALEQGVEASRGSRWRSLAGMLPSVTAQSRESRQTSNLAAFGLNPSLFPGISPVVGPYNVFDARLFLSVPLIDLSVFEDVRRSAYALDAAKLESRNARDLVVLVVTDRFLLAAAGAKRIAEVRAQVSTSEELVKLATDLRHAGVTPSIDVVRAQVQLRAQQQRLIAAENDFAKQKLQLARAIGIPSSQPIQVSDRGAEVPRPALTLDEAIQRAIASRPDYQAALARVRAAEADHRAAQADVIPSLHLNADYGANGTSPGDARRTYSVSATVQVPLVDVGRRKGRLVETSAALRQRQAEAADFAEQISADVRSAFLDVQAAEQQLSVSREQVDLARQELSLARTRFSAGVTSNLEVIQAQNEVATATESEITSAYAFNAAKAALARTLGATGSAVPVPFGNGIVK